jgi:dynein heavy chain
VPYDFSETDFRISMALLSTYLTKATLAGSGGGAGDAAVPWGTLRYLIGEAMYGEEGRWPRHGGTQRRSVPSTWVPASKLLQASRVPATCWSSPPPPPPPRASAGGRVSDSFDRRVLTTYLEEYMGDFLFDAAQPFRLFTPRDAGGGEPIGVPPPGRREGYLKAIEALPLVQSPEVPWGAAGRG